MSLFDDHFRQSPLAAHRHERRGGGSLPTRLIKLDSPAHAATDAATPELVMGLILGGSAGARWAWDGARPNWTRARRPGMLGLTPVHATGTFEVDGPSSILIVVLPYAGLVERLRCDTRVPRDFGRLHDAYSHAPVARSLALRLWRAAGSTTFGRDLLIDALAEQLLIELSGPSTEAAGEPSSGFSRAEHRRIAACAEDQAADIAALARAAAMPVRTFRRRFRAAYGCSPHHWLADRRINKARDMLRENRLPLSEIALVLGFASQAHFTEAFRSALGITPGRYRASLRT